MSATGRRDADPDAPTASAVAGRLRDASFVRFVAAPRGDALAATGVLARTLAARDAPFQVSVVDPVADRARATDADCTVTVGYRDTDADVCLAGSTAPASETAAAVVDELDGDLPVALALAGVVADGRVVESSVANAADENAVERRPGVAVPTTDLVDGLAHTTLVHAPFSGDPDATAEALDALELPETLDDEDRKRIASLVALETVGQEAASDRAGTAVERVLRPYVGGPFETVGGYADVLDATARRRPGTGVALALGHDVRESALEAWRSHARQAHAAVRAATTGRYDGLFVARAESPDAPVGTMARLVHAFHAPEAATLAVTDGVAALVTDGREPGPGPRLREAVVAVEGTSGTNGRAGHARFETDTAAFITAVREAR